MPQHQGSERHRWVAAAEIEIDGRHVRRALQRQSVRAEAGQRIDVLDVYCSECRRPFVDVADQPCVCAVTTMHLRGGPPGTRKRRAAAGTVPVPIAVRVDLDLTADDFDDQLEASSG